LTPPARESAWKRLGHLLADRRVQLGARYKNKTLFAEERGINRKMLWSIESGARDTYTPDTIRVIEAAYMLAPGSLDRTLAGGDPEPLAPAPRPVLVPSPPPGARSRAEVAEWLSRADDAVIARLVAHDEVLGMIWALPGPGGGLRARVTRIEMLAVALADDDPMMEERRQGDAGLPRGFPHAVDSVKIRCPLSKQRAYHYSLSITRNWAERGR
jgi:hypothetical protein